MLGVSKPELTKDRLNWEKTGELILNIKTGRKNAGSIRVMSIWSVFVIHSNFGKSSKMDERLFTEIEKCAKRHRSPLLEKLR